MSFFFMLPQKFYFVTTFYQDLNWKKRLFFFFLLKTYTKFITTKKKHNVKTMQPLTTLYKNTRHFTKKILKFFLLYFGLTKKDSHLWKNFSIQIDVKIELQGQKYMFFILRLTPLLPYGTILFSPPPYFLSKTKEHNKKKGK